MSEGMPPCSMAPSSHGLGRLERRYGGVTQLAAPASMMIVGEATRVGVASRC